MTIDLRVPFSGVSEMHEDSEEQKRMWQLANRLADSGSFSGWMTIEVELRSRGYPRARYWLDNKAVREDLDRRCREAQQRRSIA